MKREILCRQCTDERRAREAASPEPPKDFRRIWGEARYSLICDLCAVVIPLGTICCAWSHFYEDEASKMREWNWENTYISRSGSGLTRPNI